MNREEPNDKEIVDSICERLYAAMPKDVDVVYVKFALCKLLAKLIAETKTEEKSLVRGTPLEVKMFSKIIWGDYLEFKDEQEIEDHKAKSKIKGKKK